MRIRFSFVSFGADVKLSVLGILYIGLSGVTTGKPIIVVLDL